MSRAVFRIVDVCSRYAWWVIAGSLILALACSFYTVRHFAIKTDVKDLFPPSLPWTQRALADIAAQDAGNVVFCKKFVT